MNETPAGTHPYILDVALAPQSEVLFQWTIRKSGKIFQRSDRRFPSEAEARRNGAATVERLLTDFGR